MNPYSFPEFRAHIDEWVFGPINRLVYDRDALIGFIFMSCTIDYLASFWWGEDTRNSVKKSFTGFIDRYFPPGKYDSVGIYDSLRNGLVHLFTIKGRMYALTHNNPALHLTKDSHGHIVLDAGSFKDDLTAAKEKYFEEVVADPELHGKFYKRFNRDGFLILIPHATTP